MVCQRKSIFLSDLNSQFHSVDTGGRDHYNVVLNKGAVAQLGERLNGIQEVRGSIPLSSTKGNQYVRQSRRAYFCLLEYPLVRVARFSPSRFGLFNVIHVS